MDTTKVIRGQNIRTRKYNTGLCIFLDRIHQSGGVSYVHIVTPMNTLDCVRELDVTAVVPVNQSKVGKETAHAS